MDTMDERNAIYQLPSPAEIARQALAEAAIAVDNYWSNCVYSPTEVDPVMYRLMNDLHDALAAAGYPVG